MEDKKHIAKTGNKSGQWVSCTAKGACRNGGTHINDMTLQVTRSWKNQSQDGYVPVNKITEADVSAFKALPANEQAALEEAYTSFTEERQARLNSKEFRDRANKARKRTDFEKSIVAAIQNNVFEGKGSGTFTLKPDGTIDAPEIYSKELQTNYHRMFSAGISMLANTSDTEFTKTVRKFVQVHSETKLMDDKWAAALVEAASLTSKSGLNVRITAAIYVSDLLYDVQNNLPLGSTDGMKAAAVEFTTQAEEANRAPHETMKQRISNLFTAKK